MSAFSTSPYTYGALGKVAIVGSAPAISDFHKWLHPEIAIASAPMPLGRLDAAGLTAMGERLAQVFDFIHTYDHSDLAFFSCTSVSYTHLYTIHLEVKDGAIAFVDSPCPDHLCENYGWLSREGDWAACLPARASLTIVAG